MKKFRGKKRYFRNLWKKVNSFQLELDKVSWFDFYHIHLDWYGVGNESIKLRREHFKAYLTLYKKVLDKLETFDKPYQSWILWDGGDAGQDAVYIHTPNPNENNFPLTLEKLNEMGNIPTPFKDLIDKEEFDVGQFKLGSNSFVIQSKTQGIKL
ncbi:hypothetical protein PU629_09050 [Pullulanibacillus sp. KACC 23026]|uniref:hypothetical protein n=1 Tax=Pullulanibacillus sp. KACC 23026 TaxID=3028315 RepID=UPI0023B154D1|nr:hypothetical protein [Pullulanibacillus sp. KACC 23026]WEG14483.1 hypothetical protein PU629_09050 [Pullulanibacillus sp. KACC 23026]